MNARYRKGIHGPGRICHIQLNLFKRACCPHAPCGRNGTQSGLYVTAHAGLPRGLATAAHDFTTICSELKASGTRLLLSGTIWRFVNASAFPRSPCPASLLGNVGIGITLTLIFGASISALADEEDSTPLQEIVVTATKRPTKLLDTPISMTVLASGTLESVNADSFGDVTRLIPGLTAIDSGPGQKRYALRGLQSPGEPEVALYYDEIPIQGLPGNSLDTGDDQPDFKLWDVDRIEVLRGPQGTLYGDGSMGGAIRIISKRPELDKFEAASQAVGGITDGGGPSWRLNEMVNIPLLENRLALRLTGYFDREGGWIDEPYTPGTNVAQFTGKALNWEHTWGGRASLEFRATDNWTITGIAYYQNLHTGNSSETYPAYATSGDPYVSKAFIRTPWNDESQMFNLISTYEFGWADFVVTGSYQKRVADLNLGTTRTNLSLFGCTLATWQNTCFAHR